MAWCIMISCHKVVRSIRNTTLKLCTDCAKHFVRNAQNCEKTMDFAPAHIAMLVREFLAKNAIVTMLQLSYSPDLAPADFFFFPKLKTPMKGKHFDAIEEIKEKSKQMLLGLLKSAFQKCFEDWKKRWHKCFISEGGYLEGTS